MLPQRAQEALAGYYAFGNYDFAAHSMTMLGWGLSDDGWLEMCAPAKIERTIPSFSLAWILAAADHWHHAADPNFAASAADVANTILDHCIDQLEDGLLPCPVGQRYWQFYDWAPGMTDHDAKPHRYDAPLNLLLCMAMGAAADLADVRGSTDRASMYRQLADASRVAIDAQFWDARQQAYRTRVGGGMPEHYAELVQSLAILSRTASPEKAAALRSELMASQTGWVRTTLSQSLYKFEALLTDRARCGRWVFDTVRSDWGSMLRRGATTFWETLRGADDFDGAGSLCHGWSAIPVYLFLAHGVGIRPLEPGFRTFQLDPFPGFITGDFRATVPTPRGPIHVEWLASQADPEFTHMDKLREPCQAHSNHRRQSMLRLVRTITIFGQYFGRNAA